MFQEIFYQVGNNPNKYSKVIIEDAHTNVVLIEKNNEDYILVKVSKKATSNGHTTLTLVRVK